MNRTIRNKIDAIENILTGLNRKSKDKKVHVNVVPDLLRQRDAEDLYAADGSARKIVDRVAKEGTRKWVDVTNVEPEEKELFINYMKKLNAKAAFSKAWRWARLYGGSAIYMNVSDGQEDPKEPINWKSALSINSLVVVNRYDLQADIQTIENDETLPNYGFPNQYVLSNDNSSQMIEVHHSRILRFEGAELPSQLFKDNGYWNDSVLSSSMMAILNYSQSHDNVASLIHDYRQRILKIDNFVGMLSNNEDKLIEKRMELQDLIKSSFKTDIIDKEDDLQIVSTPLTGIKDVLGLVNNRLVAASGFPHTVMLGESPGSSMSGSGDSQRDEWYDFVSGEQEVVLENPLKTLFDYMMRVKDGPTKGNVNPEISFQFQPLKQMSEKDRAELEKVVAEKDSIYIQTQVLIPEEVAESRYGSEKFSQDTNIDTEARNKFLSFEEEPDEKRKAKKDPN